MTLHTPLNTDELEETGDTKAPKRETPFDSLIPKNRPKVEDIFGGTEIDSSEVTAAQSIPAPSASRIPAKSSNTMNPGMAQPQSQSAPTQFMGEQPIVPTLDQYQPKNAEVPMQSMRQQPLTIGDRLSALKPMVIRIIILALIACIITGVVAYAMKPELFVFGDNKNTSSQNTNTVSGDVPAVNVNENTNTKVTNPAVKATRGVNDSDGDGLTDEEEINLKTDPKKIDTDADGLSDRQEVQVYHTDPLNKDTDADTYVDGEEVRRFYNPKGSGTLINVNGAIQDAQQQKK